MRKVTSYRSNSGSVKHKDLIYVTNPNVQSYAAYVLLKSKLAARDEDREILSRFKRINFSRNYLRTILKNRGHLACTYCGKMHLKIEDKNMIVPHNTKATIDHVVPLSKGGRMFDVFNIVVSCSKCNSRKGDMILLEYLEKFKKILKPDLHVLARFF